MSILNLILISILSVSFLACTKSGDVSFSSKEILDLEFLNKPSAISGDTNPTFNFELKNTVNNTKVNEQVEFRCSLDDATYITCPETYNPSGLPVGPHNLKIKVLRAGKQIHLKEYDWVVTMAAVPFNIDGVSGANDSSADIYYANNTDADLVVSWEAAVNADEYIVEIKDNTDTTTLCGPVTVSASTHTFTTGGLCTLVDGTSYKLHVSAENIVDTVTVATNSPLTITKDITNPTGSFTTGPSSPTNSTTASFTFTDADTISGVASTECRLDSVNPLDFGACTSPVTLLGLSEGAHTYDLKITDNAGNSTVVTHAWAVNTIEVNDFNYFPAQEAVLFNNTFTATGGSGTFTYALTVNPNGATINPTTGVFAVTEASHQKINYTLRVTDTVTSLTKDFTFDVDTYPAGICVWNGFTSTAWATPSNWSFCGGAAPIATSQIAIGTAVNQPILAANQTIDSFGLGAGGGELTLSAARLTVSNDVNFMRSSVAFIGSSPTCTNCTVYTANSPVVSAGATMTLGPGLIFNLPNKLHIGNGVTGGSLATPAYTGNESERAKIQGAYNNGVLVNGALGSLSEIDIDGLFISGTNPNSLSIVSLEFSNFYQITKLDNLKLEFVTFQDVDSSTSIKLSNCGNSIVNDTSWDNITFADSYQPTRGFNINASSCSGIASISVTGDGVGYGSIYESDSNSIINWTNSLSFNCIWNGSVDTDWRNASNWTNCSNGRGGYPDQMDYAKIPIVGTMPLITGDAGLKGFGPGLGGDGGVVTIGPNTKLYLGDSVNTLTSDVTVSGSTSTCSTCKLVPSGTLSIHSGATLTLGTGLRVVLSSVSRRVDVGNGTSGGGLATLSDTGNPADWPRFIGGYSNGIVINGAPGSLSRVSLDGFGFDGLSPTVAHFDFADYYSIEKFDNLHLDSVEFGVYDTHSSIELKNCGNASFGDANWDSVTFNDIYAVTMAGNIDASACSGVGPITISGDGPGYGVVYEKDINSIINWTDSLASSCVWNGSVSNIWDNPSNWSGCTNGRNNYPDQLDWVKIPVTGTMPVLTADTYVRGFGPSVGSDGGVVTISAGARLFIVDSENSIRSDVTFIGSTSSCTNCNVYPGGDTTISADATLTLGNGVRLHINNDNDGQLLVGNGITGGNLTTVADTGNDAEWPQILGNFNHGVVINGAAGSVSSVNFDGIKIFGTWGNRHILNLMDYYEIVKLDNVHMDRVSVATGSDIHLNSCTNGTFTDLSWDGLTFVDIPNLAHNVNASSGTCSAIGPVSMPSAVGAGAGTGFELDPNNVIDWP